MTIFCVCNQFFVLNTAKHGSFVNGGVLKWNA